MSDAQRIQLSAASVEIQAASTPKGPPRFTAIAYTGIPMTISGFRYPVILDLKGMNAPRPNYPALKDHDDSRVVGHADSTTIAPSTVTVEGTISGAGPDAVEVSQAAKNGFTWQVSLGSDPIGGLRTLASGKTEQINGQTVTGPVLIADKSEISEVSFVARGADGNTSAAIAAKENSMSTQTAESTTDLRQRVERIEATCKSLANRVDEKHLGELRIQAISGEIDEAEFNEHLLSHVANHAELQEIRGNRSKPLFRRGAEDHTPDTDQIIQAALLTRAGFADVAEKEFGERVMEQSKGLHSSSLIDVIRAGYQAHGLPVPRDNDELIRAAFSRDGHIEAGVSNYSLPNTLSNVMGKVLESTYREASATWQKFCAVRSVNSFHNATSIRPSFVGEMEQVGKDGDLKHGQLDESFFTYSVDTFGKVLKVDRKTIINDDLGFLDDVAPAYGRMSARAVADLVFKTLMAAGSSYFDSSLGNEGTAALDVTSLGLAITAMQKQVDSENNDIDIQPATLLVPPELSSIAKTALQSEFTERIAENTAGSVDSVRPTGNPQRNAVKLEVESRLSNTVKFTNADVNNWFLFGKTSDIPMVVAFLGGKQVPTIDFFGFDSDANTLAATWRIYHDFGAALGDYRGAYKSTVA